MAKHVLLFFFILTLSAASWAQTLTTTRVSVADSGDPLVGGSTQQVVFGFNVDKTAGATNLTNLVISTGATDPSTVFSSVALYTSGSNFAAATNTNATVSLHSGDITFAGNPTNLFSFGAGVSNRNFYVVATILSSVSTTSGGVPQITLTLTETGTTYSTAVTETAFSLSGSTYNFQALIADFTQNADASTAIGDQNGVELMDFTVLSSSASAGQTINTQLVFTFNTDVTNILENWDLQVGGADIPGTEIYTLNGAGTQLTITAFTAVDISTPKNFQLFADTKIGALSTNDFTISLASSSATATPGVVESFTTFTNSIDVTALTADFTQNADAANAIAGQTSVELLDFTVLSNAAGTAHALNPPLVLTFNKDVSGFLSSWDLRVGGADIPGTETYTLNGAGTQLTIAAFNNVDITSSKNFQLFADIAGGASVTDDFTITLSDADVTLSGGNVETFGTLTNSIDIITSQLSDITLTGGTTASINYRTFVANSINNDQSNSVTLADFSIRDGGASDDPDNKGMSVTAIQIQVTNAGNLSQIALFDDNANTEIAGTEQTVPGSGTVNITFSPTTPISITDHGTFAINVRATFKTAVTDKQSLQISIVSATAAGGNLSGFSPVGSWASTQTASNTNIIAVNVSKLVFVANPPATSINTNFSLSVKAVDGNPYNNIDIDYIGKVDLTASGGAGTLSGGAQSLSPNLVAGQFGWTQLKINQSGTYTLDASDDAYTGQANNPTDIGDASGSVTISSSASTVTQPSALDLCYGGNFKTLGNIVITETDPSGFSSSGSFSIGLPTGYIFDTSVTTAPVISNGTASPSTLSYTGDNIVQFSYNFSSGSSNSNSITISGLKIRYPGNTAPSGGGNITRVGGTATIAGVVDGTVLGTLAAALATPPGNLGFTVLKINSGDANVDPNETRFSVSGSAVQLVGTPSGSSFEFSGPGVTFTSGQWRFNPSTLSVGTGYNITYKVRDGTDQCEFTISKSFEVYSSSITNLATSYCTNQAASLPLSVSETYIDTNIQELVSITFNPITFTFTFNYQSNYNFDGFVYYNPSTGAYLDMPKQSAAPDVWVFDPKDPIYSTVYQSLPEGYGIRIGFRVKSTFSGGIRYQASFVEIRQAPTVAITSIINNVFGGDNSRFCNDQLPLTLTGSPVNSSSSAQDEFFVDSAPQSATIGFNSLTSTWTFNPASVTGVTEGNPATFNVLYKYTDKVNGCVSVSAPKQVRVYARPAAVQASQILTNATQEICPGTAVSVVNADPVSGVEYKWYADNFPPLDPNPLIVGNSFTPPAEILTPGTYKYYVTRTLGKETFTFFSFSTIVFPGCESNRQASNPPTPFQVSVTVKPIPPPPTIPNLTREYCVNASVPPSALQVTGTSVKWYNNGTLIFTGDSPSAANLGIDNTKAGDYTFNLTQTLNGCEGVPQSLAPFTDRLSVKIKPLPDVTITSSDDADLNRICTTDGLIKFSAAEGSTVAANGTWSGTGLSGALTPNPLFGTVDLNPLNLSPGNYTLQYAYSNPITLCSNNFTKDFLIHPSVNVSVQASDACLGSPVVITNNSTINGTGTIDFASWDFDDRSALPVGDYNTSVNSNEGRTQGTYKAPTHLYTTTGNYQIIGELITNAGCTYETPTLGVLISPLPKIDFSWENPCRDVESNTEFHAIELSQPVIANLSFAWDFHLNSSLSTSFEGTGKDPNVKYLNDGTDSARLIATTLYGCQDTVIRPIYIVPKFPAIDKDISYNQGFNLVKDGWIAGGSNSSWEWGPAQVKGSEPAGSNGKVWETNLSGSNNKDEQSWVLSGCFNFTKALKPIISMDIFSNTPRGVNGAVLQYNSSGNIDDKEWITVGTTDTGINWYDDQGISNSPGNQLQNDLGWTGNKTTTEGKYDGWIKAASKLDELIGLDNIIFRIAFAAANTESDGFGFDNVFVGERSRIVLLENFTNSSAANVTVHNAKYKTTGTAAELVKIQYHTAFPGVDPIHDLNPQLNNARTAFYGITQSPTMRIDGDYKSGNALSWIDQSFEDRVLEPAGIRIKITTAKQSSGEVKVYFDIENISGVTIPLNGANLFTAIVQKSITNPTLLGNSGNTEFVYVAKEFLPSASGKKITSDLLPGKTYRDSVIWNNLTGDAIVAFVQNIDGNNKNVLQSQINLSPDLPNLVTAVENMLPEQINIYPNPASREFRVELPNIVSTDVNMYLVDQVGRRHDRGFIPAGNNSASVNVENLSEGIYILEIGSSNTGILRKKIMVVMKN